MVCVARNGEDSENTQKFAGGRQNLNGGLKRSAWATGERVPQSLGIW
jgi:hypothetical protein